MSRFDLKKLLAEANADLDAEARARLTEALNAAVEATEREAILRASEATQAALDVLKEQLRAVEAQSLAQSTKGAHSLVEAHSGTLKEMAAQIKQVEKDATLAACSVASGVSAARAIAVQTRAATKEASQAAVLLQGEKTKIQKEVETLQNVQRQTDGLLKKARTLIITGAVLAVFGVIVASWVGVQIGERSAQNAYAEEFARLDQVTFDREARIAELTEQENAALSEAHDMADLRDQIGAELNRYREMREEIGLELVRDDNIIEVRLGDVILRPWRGQTLVIIDEGRSLEAFSGGASLNGLGHYRGRMFRTRPAG